MNVLTRKQAEKMCREIIAGHAGEKFPDNLFKDSVDMLMKEANKEDVSCETEEDNNHAT